MKITFSRRIIRKCYLFYLKNIKRILKIDVQYHNNINSDLPIDIIIPTIDKDLDLLEKVIISAKKYIKHPIVNIYIISIPNVILSQIIKKHNCIFIDENSILPITKKSISYNVNGIDRSGWLFQQLLKLSGNQISTQENFLVLDSDTIFTRPKIFIYNNKTIFDHSIEYHIQYHDVYKKIMKIPTKSILSFISHNMLFNKNYLNEMKKYIEETNKSSWLDAIIQNVNYNQISGFSEYETYGNYMLTFHKKEIIRNFWQNLSCDSIPDYISSKYKSISIHSYSKKI